jgi:hypothetical protein
MFQVHDEAFPNYEIRDSNGRVWHVNPLIANLPAYIAKLQDVLNLYNRRLNAIVQPAMNELWKSQYQAAYGEMERSDVVARFIDSDKRLEFTLMQREIEKANEFLDLAKEMLESIRRIPAPPVPEPPRVNLSFNPRELDLALSRKEPIRVSMSDTFVLRTPSRTQTSRPPSRAGPRIDTSLSELLTPLPRRAPEEEISTKRSLARPLSASRPWHSDAGFLVGEMVVALHPTVFIQSRFVDLLL